MDETWLQRNRNLELFRLALIRLYVVIPRFRRILRIDPAPVRDYVPIKVYTVSGFILCTTVELKKIGHHY